MYCLERFELSSTIALPVSPGATIYQIKLLRPKNTQKRADLEKVVSRLVVWELSADLHSLAPKRPAVLVGGKNGSVGDWQSYTYRLP